MQLSAEEFQRYQQQLKLYNVGVEGQLKLKNTKILCIGAGGLGSSLLLYLTAAGVGAIGVVDDDIIELSNLHRQVLYQYRHVGMSKAVIAQKQLNALNANVDISSYLERFSSRNAKNLISQYDIVVDCADNFTTKILANDVSYHADKPFFFTAISEFRGQSAIFQGKTTPCLRCVFPETSATLPDCTDAGVLGVLPGMFGLIQATQIIKYILGIDDNVADYLLTFDTLTMQLDKYTLTSNPQCKLCVLNQIKESGNCNMIDITAETLKTRLASDENFLLLDVRSAEEHAAANIGGTLIPLQELASRVRELNSEIPIVVYCRSGARSRAAAEYLLSVGFTSVHNLKGGILGYL